MTLVKEDKITISNLYNNKVNFANLVTVLPYEKERVYRRSINNLVLTKIEESINDNKEDILISDFDILVIIPITI
jgi:hypothetical protein